MDTPPAARYSPGAVSFALRVLNIVATLFTLGSGLGVLAQDLLVDGYREYHRDWVTFVAVYCGVQAYTGADHPARLGAPVAHRRAG